mgnify:FL=1
MASPLTDKARYIQAQKFLMFLTSGVPDDTYISITEYYTSVKNGQYVNTHFYNVNDIENATKSIIKSAVENKSDIYVRCSVLKEKPNKGRGKKEHSAGSSVLWVDLDTKDGKTKTEIIQKLKEFEFVPSWVNDSGNGIHAYWKLNAFITNIDLIEKRNKWLADKLKADHCWNITQVLRIPGTRNYKDPLEIKEVITIDEFSPANTYNIFDIPEGEFSTEEDTELDFALEEELLPSDFINKLPEELQLRIVNGAGGLSNVNGVIDRSKNDWYIVMKLLELGYSAGQCLSVLTHPKWFSGSKTKESGYSYATYTVAKALVHFQKGACYRDRGLLLDSVTNEVLFYIDDKGNRKKKKIERGSNLVNPVVRFLQSNGYHFYVDEEERTGYIATPEGKVLTAFKDDMEYADWIQEISGFTEVEQEHKILKSGLASQVRQIGESAKLTPWCYFDNSNWTFYILLDMRGRKVLKVSANNKIEVVPNGTDRKLLRKSGLVEKPIEWDSDIDIEKGLKFFFDNFVKWIATDKISRGVIACYALATPLIYGFPIQTYPLLHLMGQSGSGKSQTMMMFSSWLHGAAKLLNSTTAASYRIASKEVLLPFDDYEYLSEELQHFILTASTGITRQKSGKNVDDVVSQSAHVLMALTSINEIEKETVRRRAMVIDINKEQHPTDGYSENMWSTISQNRSMLWSAYAKWLSSDILPYLKETNFYGLVKRTENLIPLDIFKGLAPFITLMWVIGSNLQKYVPDILGIEQSDIESVINEWVRVLKLGDNKEIAERKPLLTAIESVFDVYFGQHSFNTLTVSEKAGQSRTRITETILKNDDYRIRPIQSDKLPQKGKWIGLEGTVSEWLITLRTATKGSIKINTAQKLGHEFKNLLGSEPTMKHNKESEPINKWGYCFIKLENAGHAQSNRGWRILKQVDDFTAEI